MLNLITVVAAMIVSAECTGETDKRTTMYERRRGVDDLAFSNNLILGTSARTRGECGARCQANQNCATFTFIPSSHTCRKHKCFSTSGPSLHSPGAATFILRRLPSADRLRDFDVEIFTQDPVDNPTAEAALCYHYTGSMPPGVTETLYCPIPYCGRYVRIRKSSANLSLCEVQVLGTN
ncbi:hypothetical protein BaRGS_00011159 [Batillaria attramentaria]|uniref:Apple domain-containing protein n=1 Tax=Batillaria attramentaria TaxID=370345 RepID=A0ABD0LD82_9CAEN